MRYGQEILLSLSEEGKIISIRKNALATKKVIGFVSTSNPRADRYAWSGTLYKIREAIELAGYELIWIRCEPNKYIHLLMKIFLRLIYGMYWKRTKTYVWFCSKSISRGELSKCDYLFFPGGAQMIRYLKKNIQDIPPAIYYTDACFCQMVNYYWYGVPQWIFRQADQLEHCAIDESSLVIHSSKWASDCAIKEYGCPVDKAVVLEFGANFDQKDIIASESYKGGELRLLFSGVNWKRKGGAIAVETAKKLNEKGILSKLYIVGLDVSKIPLKYKNLDYVEYLGFLNKNVPLEYEKYVEVFMKCHCLLLPTLAECSSIVICEAAAFGLPSLVYDTGGLANYVINGETGYRLHKGATAEDFAKKIEELIKNDDFERLREGALALYNRISWGAWSRRFKDIIETNLGGHSKTVA